MVSYLIRLHLPAGHLDRPSGRGCVLRSPSSRASAPGATRRSRPCVLRRLQTRADNKSAQKEREKDEVDDDPCENCFSRRIRVQEAVPRTAPNAAACEASASGVGSDGRNGRCCSPRRNCMETRENHGPHIGDHRIKAKAPHEVAHPAAAACSGLPLRVRGWRSPPAQKRPAPAADRSNLMQRRQSFGETATCQGPNFFPNQNGC